MLYCYQYDPMTGKYGVVIINAAAGGLNVLILGIFMTLMFLRERKRPLVVPPAGPGQRRDEHI